MTEYNCSERLAIVLKFSYNYDNFNIKKENNMSVNESQIKTPQPAQSMMTML